MKIKLNTDFRDYYDHWFCYNHEKHDMVYERLTNGGMSRIEMFRFFAERNCRIPINGYVKEILPFLLTNYNKKLVCQLTEIGVDVIVYTNINRHAGEGKLKCSYQYALENYPNNYCSLYIKNNLYDKPTTSRILVIGERAFILKYQSDDLWRSNCGNVDIRILCEVEFSEYYHQLKDFPYPIYAIDLVPDNDEVMYAVDLNISPCIKGTGIEHIVLGSDVYQSIENYYKNILC